MAPGTCWTDERPAFAQNVKVARWLLVAVVSLSNHLLSSTVAEAVEYWPSSTGWENVEASAAGMDPAKLAKAIAYGEDRGGSGLVVRRGRVVGQWGDQTVKYQLKSTTKSIGSILLGVAIKDQRVTLETKLVPTLEAELATQEPLAKAVKWVPNLRVRHLLTHTAGFDKVGGFSPMLFAPGTGWFYSDSGANWLADLLTVKYMRDLSLVLGHRVLRPMGIAASRVVWRENFYRPKTLRGIVRREFGSGISTDVDVMARLGLMLLRNGRWKTTRIVQGNYPDLAGSQAPGIAGLPWMEDNPDNCDPPNAHYGLLFWNNSAGQRTGVPRDAYWSAGLGTSFILVIPSLGIVASRAGEQWPEAEAGFGRRSVSFGEMDLTIHLMDFGRRKAFARAFQKVESQIDLIDARRHSAGTPAKYVHAPQQRAACKFAHPLPTAQHIRPGSGQHLPPRPAARAECPQRTQQPRERSPGCAAPIASAAGEGVVPAADRRGRTSRTCKGSTRRPSWS